MIITSSSFLVFLANIVKFMNDEQIFPKPRELIPERFLEDAPNGIGLSIKVFCNFVTLQS